MNIRRSLPLTICALLWAMAGFAQNTDETNEWQVLCNDAGTCQIENKVVGLGEVVTQILIYKVGESVILEYKVPLGITIKKGVTLRVDVQPDMETSILTCEENGCLGFIALDERLAAIMKRGAKLQLIVESYRERTFYSFDYNLTGFTRSFNSFLNDGN